MASFGLFSSLSCILLLFLLHITPSLAFPSMLVESKSGCWIDLNDSEEVVMNHNIVMYSESSRPDLYVAVVHDDTQEFNKGPVEMKTNVEKYKVTVVNPGEALPDVQYALETSEGASFVGGGCDGQRRTHGRLSDATHHELFIESKEEEIRVVAAWAGGHEAVQLTDVLRLVPQGTTASDAKKEEPKENENDKKEVDTEKEERKEEEVIGVQVVEKHVPHDVDAEKIQPPNEVDNENIDKESAHKDALDQEIKVLREEVQDLGKNHEDIEDKMHATVQKAKEHYDVKKNEKKVDTDKNDARDEALQVKKQTAHEKTIQRFKDAYKEKHKLAAPERTQKDIDAENAKRDVINRFKESYREKHKIKDKKPNKEETKKEIYKRMKEEMFVQSKVSRREPPRSFVERVKRRYKAREEQDDPVVNMRNYMYGVIFFIIANLCVLQTCVYLGKRDKGRRHE